MIINLDMDGVLADFDGKCIEYLGKPMWHYTTDIEAWTKLGKRKDDIFLKLEPLSDAEHLVKNVLKLADEYNFKVSVLSALPRNIMISSAEEHKREWLSKYFPELVNRFKIGPYSGDKYKHCFNKTDILIDDYDLNVEEWARLGLGVGILHKNSVKSLEYLECYLSTGELVVK